MDGILVINKPAGMTSFDVIARLRKKYSQKKFGHAGTLDPMASGVLVVFAGKACKALQFLGDTDKEYVASIELGASYDTDDVSGTLLQKAPVRESFDFQQVLDTFLGENHQLVPKAAAKKVNGRKLYEYLRAGQDVPQVYSDVVIHEIEALDRNTLSFRVACSGGTYVRSICRDFGQRTGNLAAMKSLVRTRANGFSIDQAQDLEADHVLYPIAQALDLPRVQIEQPKPVLDGRALHLDLDARRVLLMHGEDALAVYEQDGQDRTLFRSARGLF